MLATPTQCIGMATFGRASSRTGGHRRYSEFKNANSANRSAVGKASNR
jgi:hypothetical protein